jgi:hypothetical protein
MPDRITWQWIEGNYFPSFVADAERAGFDRRAFALVTPADTPVLAQRDPESGAIVSVIAQFATPRDAETYMNGMRRGWTLPDGMRGTPDGASRREALKRASERD